MSTCDDIAKEIPVLFSTAEEPLCREALKKRDFSNFPEIPTWVRSHLEECENCRSDLDWFLQIRNELDVTSYPCIHIAYACSKKTNRLANRDFGIYSLIYDRPSSTGLVIEFCPWCGTKLNVSAGITEKNSSPHR